MAEHGKSIVATREAFGTRHHNHLPARRSKAGVFSGSPSLARVSSYAEVCCFNS